MEFDLEGKYADRAYTLLASLVIPRPIALVTTIGENGVVNAAPFSFFNLMGASPPILAVAPGNRDDGSPKDTARNIRLNHEFVVNLVDESIAEAMNRAGRVPALRRQRNRARRIHHRPLHAREAAAHRRGPREHGMPGMGHAPDRR